MYDSSTETLDRLSVVVPSAKYEAVLRALACWWFAPDNETVMTGSAQVASLSVSFVGLPVMVGKIV